MWSTLRLGYKKHSGVPVTWHSVGPIGRHTHSEATAILSNAGPQFKLVEASQNIDQANRGRVVGGVLLARSFGKLKPIQLRTLQQKVGASLCYWLFAFGAVKLIGLVNSRNSSLPADIGNPHPITLKFVLQKSLMRGRK